jgi:hypothetical protein
MVAPLIVAGIVEGVKEIFNRIVPDKNAQAKFERELDSKEFDAVVQNDLAQLKVNEKEAEHSSLFVSGWRPYIGWLCGGALTVGFFAKIVLPMVVALLVFTDIDKTKINEFMRMMKELDLEIYISILMALLGMTASRSYDKKQGTDTKHVSPPNWFKGGK